MDKNNSAAGWQQQYTINDVETLKVLAHPQRLAILRNLDKPRTVKEVAERMDADPTKLYYHVRMMENADVVIVTETNVVSGIIEKKYRAAAREYQVAEDLVFSDSFDGSNLHDIAKSLFDNAQYHLRRSVESELINLKEPNDQITNALFTNSYKLNDTQLREFNERLQLLTGDLTDWTKANADQEATEYLLTFAFFPIADTDSD